MFSRFTITHRVNCIGVITKGNWQNYYQTILSVTVCSLDVVKRNPGNGGKPPRIPLRFIRATLFWSNSRHLQLDIILHRLIAQSLTNTSK